MGDSDDSDSEIEGEQPTAADLENDYQDDNYPSDSEDDSEEDDDDDENDDDEDNEDDEDDDDSDDEVAGEIPIPTSALLGPPIESDSEDAAEDYEPAGQPGSDAEPKDYEDGIDEDEIDDDEIDDALEDEEDEIDSEDEMPPPKKQKTAETV